MRFPIVSISAPVLVLLASPALAHQPYPDDAPGASYTSAPEPSSPTYDPGDDASNYRRRYPGFDPAARDAWLADCHDRIAPRDPGPGPGECEAYLDNYYSAYTGRGYAGGYAQSPGYAQPGYSGSAGPVAMMPQRSTETVEYVTEYVPVKTRHRAIPRRTRMVPDKRVKLTRTK
ncbi:hypothetical protein WSK_0267 [Novosphingobium sp. Rr 2-17]|uniref:hypothetical protein n=1 Tax=Novosphingobium sp. Rr 2-17 TaxID=555793 RepID=UPI0002698822|nr:hypothetical protein [Novosphingobium sp. Rr 2-17]EIZ81115.1 hypothetical protein WSK_0267 [Novosphingobium sp. Rr 2-17]